MLFISGRISLDLAHTGGPGPYKVFERLHTPDDLSVWLTICELELNNVTVTQTDLKSAYKLRWAIWKAANAVRLGRQPERTDVEVINTIAAKPALAPAFDADRQHAIWRQPATAQAALVYIARDAIDVLSHHTQSPIQQCENPNCPLLFVDYSRAGKRKWCSMGRCGTMMKVAKYRKIKKEWT